MVTDRREVEKSIRIRATKQLYISLYGLREAGRGSSLRAGRSGDRIPVGPRLSAFVLTGPGALPTSYAMGNRFFPGVKRPGRSVGRPPHLAPRLKKE